MEPSDLITVFRLARLLAVWVVTGSALGRTLDPSANGPKGGDFVPRHISLATAAGVVLALAGAAPASAGNPLAAQWQFDEPNGSIAHDSSVHGNHGAITGAQSLSGRFGRALHFDGVDDMVQIPGSASLQPANVTVETWVRSSGSPGEFRHISSQGASSCMAASYGLYTGSDGGLEFYVSDGTNFVISPDAGTGVWDGAWHHAAGTFDGSTVRLYVDGVQVGTGTAPAAMGYDLPTSNDYFVGTFGGDCPSSHAFAGDIDEPRVWQRALAPDEIAASAAMGAGSARRTAVDHDGDESIVYPDDFADGRTTTISIESASGSQLIKSVRIQQILPLTALATCGNLLSGNCAITLTNGGRTAKLSVRRLLGIVATRVTLQVRLSGGRAFLVTVEP